jgi:pyruvate dehydrogenase E1 component
MVEASQTDFIDEQEEWIESLDSVIKYSGPKAAKSILEALDRRAKELGLIHEAPKYSPYQNSIPIEEQPHYPGNQRLEERINAVLRWNALAMVMRANLKSGELGGHLASFSSAAEIFEIGFNHFFRAGDDGDLVYFQPHSAPGVYARAFLEGRLEEKHLANYRQEAFTDGLSSYPHPWLMPDFWQFPTGSMGLGPLSAVYNARFMRYLQARGMAQTEGRHVWGIFGDGEMDEPESLAGISLAAREKLDNLTFIINCNLQRLDGPVRGNGQIIPELEAIFHGAGWNVIKVLWGSEWDSLFARDKNHALLRCFSKTVDGTYQTLGAKDGDYNLKNFFAKDPEALALVAHMSDDEIDALRRGGHDFRKLYAAFEAAKNTKGRPTIILAKTKKGFGMGSTGESRMTAHQTKKLDLEALLEFRNRFSLPISDADVEALNFYRPDEDSEEMRYLHERRKSLGGYLPKRRQKSEAVNVPKLKDFASFALDANDKGTSTTMAFVRMLSGLLRDKIFGPRLVPIVADEARTFGMASLFRQIGIYAPFGQFYEPEDSSSLLSYQEKEDGQLLEEGISEAGALSSWIAAATSYSTHNTPMLPIYIYYSMFGFQRVGDLIWAAGDQRARGFLIGATAGKTTLSGEGLQHQDGVSQLIASTVPNCRAYDPAYAYELAIIFEHGAKRMLEEQHDEFYYLTVMNENYAQPACPEGIDENVMKGMYRLSEKKSSRSKGKVRLLGSGTILQEVEAAAKMLVDDWQISTDVFSVTSYSELERDARDIARRNRLNGGRQQSHVEGQLPGNEPVIATSDYVRACPQLISPYVEGRFVALGTDGFGRSDTRVNLRSFFEVDRHHIVIAALDALVRDGFLEQSVVTSALLKYRINQKYLAPWME